MQTKTTWRAQERQNKVPVQIVIDGNPDWQRFLNGSMKLTSPGFIEMCGGTEVPLHKYLWAEAEVNDVSFERTALSALLGRGFVLEELELEFTNSESSAWGKCVWYKEHPSYTAPAAESLFEGCHPKWYGFLESVFKTERAGDQKHGLFSLQMAGAALMGLNVRVLLHKAMIYHKVVLSSPQAAVAA